MWVLFLIAGLPTELYSIWEAYPWRLGEAFCYLRQTMMEATSYASVLTITSFTVERYLAICHPLLAHKIAALSRYLPRFLSRYLPRFLLLQTPACTDLKCKCTHVYNTCSFIVLFSLQICIGLPATCNNNLQEMRKEGGKIDRKIERKKGTSLNWLKYTYLHFQNWRQR